MAAVDVIALALRDGAKHSRVPSERILQLMGHRQRWKYPLLVRGGEPDVQVWNIGRIGEEGLRYSERCGMKHMVVGTKRAQSRPRYRTLVRLPRSRGGVVVLGEPTAEAWNEDDATPLPAHRGATEEAHGVVRRQEEDLLDELVHESLRHAGFGLGDWAGQRSEAKLRTNCDSDGWISVGRRCRQGQPNL